MKRTFVRFGLVSLIAALSLTQAGFFGKRRDVDERRDDVRVMRDEVLELLKKERPGAWKGLPDAEGYAVFSNIGVNVILASFAGGRGMVIDNKSGKETFMRMASGGIGIGLGVKDFRAVFVFHDREKLETFIRHGWDFSGQADAAARSDNKGGSAAGSGTIIPGVELYQFTKTGLALQATLQGTKYWQDRDLNE